MLPKEVAYVRVQIFFNQKNFALAQLDNLGMLAPSNIALRTKHTFVRQALQLLPL
jgi:hypothetical protein